MDANAKSRMKELQKKAKQSLKGEPSHRIYSTKSLFKYNIQRWNLTIKERLLEEKHGKLITLKPFNDDIGIADNKQQKFVKQLQGITDEEGLKISYDTKDGLYQHYNKLFVAGTKDPIDMVDDLKLPFDDTLNKSHRGRTADAYYRSHHEIDTAIGHSLGAAVGLSLEKQY